MRAAALDLTPLAAGTLTAAAPAAAADFSVRRDQLLHLSLTARAADGRAAAVRLSVRDKGGREVLALTCPAGRTVTGDVLLAAGQYQVVVAGAPADPARPLPDLTFDLAGLVRTDPIGLTPIDPSADPTTVLPPPPPPVFTVFLPFFGLYTLPI